MRTGDPNPGIGAYKRRQRGRDALGDANRTERPLPCAAGPNSVGDRISARTPLAEGSAGVCGSRIQTTSLQLRPLHLPRFLSNQALPWFTSEPTRSVRWQRERFRRFWARRSRVNQRHRSRPAIAVETRRLIERMVAASPLWRAPWIHGELKMLRIEISERTVSRMLRRLPRPPGETWKTFLRNHLGQAVSIDAL